MTPEEIAGKRSDLQIVRSVSKNLIFRELIDLQKAEALWEIALQLAEMNARQDAKHHPLDIPSKVPPPELVKEDGRICHCGAREDDPVAHGYPDGSYAKNDRGGDWIPHDFKPLQT